MITSDFLLPDEMTLEAAGHSLARHLDARCGAFRQVDRTFYDTFDGLLYAAGLSLVHEDGELVLFEPASGALRIRRRTPRPTEPLLAWNLEAGSLREALTAIIDVRALLPLVRVHSRVRALAVLDGERKTVVRAVLEQPALAHGSSAQTALRARLGLSSVRGYDDELARVRYALEHELGFKAADRPLLDEAVTAAGATLGGVSSKIHVALGYEQRSDTAAVAVLRRLLAVIEANLEGAIADVDSEFLHDLRISVRRSRAVQRELKRVFPPRELAHYRAEFRWLQQVTGDARDLDVYMLEFDAYRQMLPEVMRFDLDPLLEVLRNQRKAAREEMVTALAGERASSLLADWSTFLSGLETLSDEDRPDAARPIGEVARERIRKVYKQLVRMGSAIDECSPAEEYHELRKEGKELRYLLELFAAPLYPGVRPIIRALKALQEVLGRHQDREVQVARLSSLREEVARLQNGPAALMAMGALVQRLGEDELTARTEFAQRFATFASKPQQKLIKQMFG